MLPGMYSYNPPLPGQMASQRQPPAPGTAMTIPSLVDQGGMARHQPGSTGTTVVRRPRSTLITIYSTVYYRTTETAPPTEKQLQAETPDRPEASRDGSDGADRR